MSEKETLMTLKTQTGGEGTDPEALGGTHGAASRSKGELPLLGLFAVGFGLLGIFTIGPVFVPLALIFGLIAIFAGQILWGLAAVILALVGVLSSPTLMLVLGIGAFFAWLGIPLPF